jgi:VanZ family protein
LSPFRYTAQASAIQFFPFMAHYERTSMLALSDFFEAALLYFPMGFVIALHYGRGRLAWALALSATALVSVPLEVAQRHVVGRYADISDPIFALVGAAAGVYAWRVGSRFSRTSVGTYECQSELTMSVGTDDVSPN